MNIYNGEPISKNLHISKEDMSKLKFKTGDVVKVVKKDRCVPCTIKDGKPDYKNGDILVILCHIASNQYEYYLGDESYSGRIIFQEEVDFCEEDPNINIDHYMFVAELLRHDISEKIEHIRCVGLFSKNTLFAYNSILKDESFIDICLGFAKKLDLKIMKFYLGDSIEVKYSYLNGACVKIKLSKYTEDYKESRLLSFRSVEPHFIIKRSGKGFFDEDKMIEVEKCFAEYMSKILKDYID